MKRIGIYSGTFDPVHAGHITFALQAMQAAKLDHVYFLPERRPRHKQQVEHFAHRVAMLKRAVKPHARLGVLEYVDINFSINRTLPKLQQQFTGSELVFLLGSDSCHHLPEWPYAERLLATSELVIGVRDSDTTSVISEEVAEWSMQPKAVAIIESYAPDVSSRNIREALRHRTSVRGVLQSVAHYSNQHWLYVSLQ